MMIFKNTKLCRLNEPVFLTETKLENSSFKPCQPHETLGLVFVPPCPNSELLIHSLGDFDMVCLKLESRKLSNKAVNEQLEKKIAEFANANRGANKADRTPSRAEKAQMKDDLIFEMLPKIFTTSDLLYAYFDHKAGLIVVDTNNANKAELLLSELRKCLGSLPCVPVAVNNDVSEAMTSYLKNRQAIVSKKESEVVFSLGYDVEMKSSKGDVKEVAKLKNQILINSDVTEHLINGKVAVKLALDWKDKVSFILSDNLTISRIKFLNIESTGETPAERFDSDFALMTGEFREFFNDLFGLFGSLNETP